MRVAIIGASGLVGGNCLQVFREKGWSCLGTHFGFATEHTVYYNTLEPDHAQNPDWDHFAPEVIVNCGALTHVDHCELHPEESFERTVQSNRNILELARRYQARVVYISTDYVFDGRNGPYTEDAPQNPLSVYGRHKQTAERETLESGLHTLVLRITNVYGDEIRGKNFVARLLNQLSEGKQPELVLPADQYATPVNAADLAQALYLLLRDGKTGVYHIASTDWLNRVQLALKVLSFFPDSPYTLKAMRTEDMQQPAKRPLFGGLIAHKFLSEYPEFRFSGVDMYLLSKI